MKKIILAALVAVSAVSANAQIWMGGSLGYYGQKYDNGGDALHTVTISPEIGYTLSDKWDIALAINEQVLTDGDNTANIFSIAPYARFTFAKAGIASFFVDGGFIVGTTNWNGEYKTNKSNTTWGIGLRPGVKVALSDKVSLVGKLGYLGYRGIENGVNSWGFGVDNNDISLGMYWSF